MENNINIFQNNNYKSIMRLCLRGKNRRGALSRAAEEMNCQRSYLSRVMNSKMDLTMDQAFVLCRHLKFTPDEREYFICLLEHDRASDKTYREYLNEKVKKLRSQQENIGRIISRTETTPDNSGLYFSTWYYCAIHLLTSSPKYQTREAIATKLELPQSIVSEVLQQLLKWGAITNKFNKWEYKQGEFHLSKFNPYVNLHHNNWRSRAILDSQSADNQNLHYTNIQIARIEDIAKIKDLALEFIRKCDKILGPSDPEEGVVINLDVFNL